MTVAATGYGPQINSLTAAADPRVAGLSGRVGSIAWDGTYAYEKVGTGATHWKRLGIETSSVAVDVQTVTFSGLNGDLDGGYRIRGYIVAPAGVGATYTLRPNGLATNQIRQKLFADNSGVTRTGAADLAIETISAGCVLTFDVTLTSRTGRNRRYWCTSGWQSAGSGHINTEIKGEWQETATNITSVDVFASVAAGIVAGSLITLERIGDPLT